MSAMGLYQPGRSVLHRSRAGAKLLVLLVLGAVVVWLPSWWQVAVAVGCVLALYAVAGLPAVLAWRQVRPLLAVLLVVAVVQVLVAGAARAAEVVLTLLALVLAAGLVTLTTRTTAMVAVVESLVRPLRRFGADPERVGLLVALGTRSVPLVVGLAEEVREAQLARGLGASPRAFAVPLIVRALRKSDAMAEALVARGALDDDDEDPSGRPPGPAGQPSSGTTSG